MCELFAVSSGHDIQLNSYLQEFFSHCNEHPNGWGIADLDPNHMLIEKEAIKATDSKNLRRMLMEDIASRNFLAHIRRATIGDINVRNNHPFAKRDISGREWVLIHNGTIFESAEVNAYQKMQCGTTDSERILLYIVDQMDKAIQNKGEVSDEERFQIIDEIVVKITPGNKVNLIVFDGDNYYIHKNQEDTLFVKKKDGAAIFSTVPLDDEKWDEVPMNQLQRYQYGALMQTGTIHQNTYIYIEEQYKYLYMDYAHM